MRVPIIVPDLRSGDEPLQISSWLVDEGDFVIAGDLVAELLFPGITIDIAAECSGRLIKIARPVDSSIVAGETIGWLDDEESGTTKSVEKSQLP